MCGIIVITIYSAENEQFQKALSRLSPRGPQKTRAVQINGYVFGFTRLAINDPTPHGDQPMIDPSTFSTLVCNGEIYSQEEAEAIIGDDYLSQFPNRSDCRVLLPLYHKVGIERMLDLIKRDEFAFVLLDAPNSKLIAARDPLGIRPLYYAFDEDKHIIFASELKALQGIAFHGPWQFPPGYYWDGERFIPYVSYDIPPTIDLNIKDILIDATQRRLKADVPIGALLSGGLDSSLVCAITAKTFEDPSKFRTFAIGSSIDARDLKYARQVADYIGSTHTEALITPEMAIEGLRSLIWALESWDVTTIRAGIGMYLLASWVAQNTDVRVLLTGEASDELFGYKYTDYAPSPEEFQKESLKRVSSIHIYDGQRADRCISANGLEARVPFADWSFVSHVLGINPEKKMIGANERKIGKYLLRQAFEGEELIPDSILWRDKEAFSDGVGFSIVDGLKDYANQKYSDQELEHGQKKYEYHCPPKTKEALLYREIFEEYFPGRAYLVPEPWMPNREWEGCKGATDPSARVLGCYRLHSS